MQRRHFLVGPAAAGLAVSAKRATAQTPVLTTVTFGAIGIASFNWSVLVAKQLGFWAANGINVDVIFTGSVAANVQQTTTGAIDVGEIASTQLIQAILGGAPIVAIAQHLATAPYLVLGRKDLTSIAQLKGKTIVVGGVNDITRVFMDRVLASNNLKAGDYTYVYAGATEARFAALVNGGADAAILSPPISTRAANEGYPVLEEVAKYFPSFFFDTLAARPVWFRQRPDLALGFVKGYLQGVQWLYAPANRTRAIALLADATHVNVEEATTSYELFVVKRAFSATGVMTARDVNVVLDAMAKNGQIQTPLPPASRFYDNTLVNQAARELRTVRR